MKSFPCKIMIAMACKKRAIVNVIHSMATIVLAGSGMVATAGDVIPAVPASPDKAARYLIYLHGSGIDRVGLYRASENFRANTQALAARGFTVIAEVRPQYAIRKVPEDLDTYARRIAAQVETLLQAQVPARSIAVVGYSRGGSIALMASGYVNNREVGYAILAGCVSETGEYKQYVPVLLLDVVPKLNGRFLSLVDASDPDFASCRGYFASAPGKPDLQETILRTGKGHGLFSEPLEVWLLPVTEWAEVK